MVVRSSGRTRQHTRTISSSSRWHGGKLQRESEDRGRKCLGRDKAKEKKKTGGEDRQGARRKGQRW